MNDRTGNYRGYPPVDSVDSMSGAATSLLLAGPSSPPPFVEAGHPRPRSSAWVELCPWPLVEDGPPVGAVYERGGRLRVISTRILAVYPDSDGVGLQDHVSVSCAGHRPTVREVALALAAFGMVGTEEDNHHPGIARHFWRAVDPAHRVECQCKTTETTIVDGNYAWTNPIDAVEGESCRGCEFERLSGRPCPLHRRRPR